MSPAVSVLIAVRNPGRFLEPALRSLASQTFADFEAIVVDNGSRDGSDRVIAAWAEKDARFRLLQHPGFGLARCLNFAAAHARAPLLARLDGDDVLLPDRLRLQFERFGREPQLGLLGACVDLIDANDRLIGRRTLAMTDAELRAYLRKGNPFVHSTIMMRRSVFELVAGYRTSLRLCEDFDLWCRLSEVTLMANCSEVLARYRIHENAMSADRPIRMVLSDTSIVAASRARAAGRPEPFVAGGPALRQALPILGLSRVELRYRVLKGVVGAARLALVRGDQVLARRLRRRALSLLPGLCSSDRWRGLVQILTSYFRSGSRARRKAALRRLLGRNDSTMVEPVRD